MCCLTEVKKNIFPFFDTMCTTGVPMEVRRAVCRLHRDESRSQPRNIEDLPTLVSTPWVCYCPRVRATKCTIWTQLSHLIILSGSNFHPLSLLRYTVKVSTYLALYKYILYSNSMMLDQFILHIKATTPRGIKAETK